MKVKKFFILLIIFLAIIVSYFCFNKINVYAIDLGYKIAESPEIYQMGTEQYPYWVEFIDGHPEENKIPKRVFLYELELPEGTVMYNSPVRGNTIDLYDPNGDTSAPKRYRFAWGQIFYWSVDNKATKPEDFKITIDSVNNLDISKPENFNAMYTILYNRRNRAGISYVTNRGKQYPVTYPANDVTWSTFLPNPGTATYKTATYEIESKSIANWNFKPLPDSTSIGAIPWLSYSSTLKGLPRYVYAANPWEEYGGTTMFPRDIGNYEELLVIDPATVIPQPWTVIPQLPMDKGRVNKEFENNRYKASDEMKMTYQVFRTFYPSVGNLINLINAKIKINDPKYAKYASYTDQLERETAIFLDYFAVRTYAGPDTYGWYEYKLDLDPNGSHFYKYGTLRTPKLKPNKDFIFATEERPLYDEKGTKYVMTLWDRDPDGDGIYEAANTIRLYPGKDKLKPDHKYSLYAYGKFIGREGELTYHNGIVANVLVAYNDYVEGTQDQRKYLKERIHGHPAQYVKTQHILEKNEHAIIGELLDFKVLDAFTFPKEVQNPETGQMELVKKISIYFYTPYQAEDPYTGESHPSWHAKDDFDKDDNFIAPDFCVLTFDVEQPMRDLKITDFKLYDPNPDDPKLARFLTEGETLERGKTYKAIVTVKNTSDYFTTEKNIGIHLFNGVKGEQYTTNSVQPNLTSLTDKKKQIPEGSAGTTNPIPPEGTIQFVTDIAIPKEGYVPSTVKFTALIPDLYDGTDNIRYDKDDKKDLTFRVGAPASENLKIVDIQLFDATTGTEFKSQNLDGTYKFTPNKKYTAVVTMAKEGKKALGSATDTKHPRVLLKLIEYSGTGGSTKIISEYYLRAKSNSYYQATSSQQTITLEFDLKNFPINGNRVTLVACVPDEYSNFNGINYNEITGNEDEMEKTWSADLDFSVSNFILYPAVVTGADCQTSFSQTISFSATLSMVNNTADIFIDGVSLVVKDKNGSIVYRDDNITFSNGVYSKPYSGTFPNPYTLKIDGGTNYSGTSYLQGNNPFTIEINTSPIKYQETNWSNNSATNEVLLKSFCYKPPVPMPCMTPNTRTEWGPVTFHYTQRKGEMIRYTYKRSVCSGIEPNITCEEYEVTSYYCNPDLRPNIPPQQKSFWETLNITGIWFRSQDTVDKGYNGYINIKGDNKKATVRAGQWFEVYVETQYATNRSDMPGPSPYSSDMCNYLRRTPGYSTVNPAPSFIWWKIEGYSVNEFMPFNYGSGGYVKKYYLPQKIDKFGQTSSRRFIPENGKDGVINITVATDDQFYGYVFDSQHPYKVLCDRTTAKIYIVGGSNVKSQVTEE